MQLCNLDCWFY